MKYRILFIAAAFIACFSASQAMAADTDGEIRLAGFCSSCHGPSGSGPGETIPYIGGQTKEYIVTAMTEMKNKARHATVMEKISLGYTPEEIEAIALFYSKIPWKNSDNKIDKKLAAKGKGISKECASCHGEKGLGEGETPRISGQPAKYLYYALLEYKNKQRNNDGGAASMEIVTDLSDDQLKALAEYYSGLK